jgi:Ca-activated chloride channel homolog
MIWRTPAAFLLILPIVAILWWHYKQKVKPAAFVYSSLSLFKEVAPSWRARLVVLPKLLKIVALVLAIIALARPQRADIKVKKNIEGIDIMIALDVSDSMLIEDMTPMNRLESAKSTINDFVKGRASDRIGLVVFSGESYTRVPLTLDYELLLNSLSAVVTNQNIKMGTALGVALANAVSRLKDSVAKSRVVIFLTDGENNSGTIDPETALEIANGYGVKVYSIGVGRDGNTRIPVYVTDNFGNKVKRYQSFYSKINEELLNRLGTETGGKYYRATSSPALQSIFADIDRLERTKIEINQYKKYVELFPPVLQWAIWLYALSLLLGCTILRSLP